MLSGEDCKRKQVQFRPRFWIQCDKCRNSWSARKNARRAFDEAVFGFLQGNPVVCPKCGEKDRLLVFISASGYCIDLVLTDHRVFSPAVSVPVQ